MVKTYVGQKIIHLESVDSTNNYTANLIKAGEITSGAVILSDIQTEGRGQRGNSWQSLPFENLTFSFFIKPSLINNITPITINHCVSLALAEFLLSQGITPQLKWPNDIYVKDHKIAGILIENNFNSGLITSSIIGVGLNVNQLHFESLNATSLTHLTAKKYSIKSILFDIIYQLNRQFQLFESNGAVITKKAFDALLWRKNIVSTFILDNKNVKGTIQGTNEEGSLLVLIDDKISSFRNGEIAYGINESPD